MRRSIREELRRLRRAGAGQRFRDRHARRLGAPLWSRAAMIAAGLVVAVGGLLVPGPGFTAVTLGLALIAGEVFAVAYAIDHLEGSAAERFGALLERWRALPHHRLLATLTVALDVLITLVISTYVMTWLGAPVPGWLERLLGFLPGL